MVVDGLLLKHDANRRTVSAHCAHALLISAKRNSGEKAPLINRRSAKILDSQRLGKGIDGSKAMLSRLPLCIKPA